MSAEALINHATSTAESLSSSAHRTNSLASFKNLGLPTTRWEEWKYTNVLPLVPVDFVSAEVAPYHPSSLDAELTDALKADVVEMVVVNGIVDSASFTTIEGVTISTYNNTDEMPEVVKRAHSTVIGKTPVETHPFVALNGAITKNTLVIHVAKNVVVDQQLLIRYVTDSTAGSVVSATSLLVVCEENASINVLEVHSSVGEHQSITTPQTNCVVNKNATVSLTKLIDGKGKASHIGYTGGFVYRDAVFKTATYCIGGSFVRNDLQIELLEPNANAYLDGISVMNGKEFADNHTVVDHTVPHCHSEELYKGVYLDSSVGVFNGKIFVRPQAQKTTAYQSNHSLLLSDKAHMNAKPQLEIWADDVKCSHGATMGELDEDALFYLRSRGFDLNAAKQVLTYAFVAEVVERCLVDGLEDYLEKRIKLKLYPDLES